MADALTQAMVDLVSAAGGHKVHWHSRAAPLLAPYVGQHDLAIALAQASVDMLRAVLDDGHPLVALALIGLAAVNLALGQPEAAKQVLSP
jgi:hypothetical protein